MKQMLYIVYDSSISMSYAHDQQSKKEALIEFIRKHIEFFEESYAGVRLFTFAQTLISQNDYFFRKINGSFWDKLFDKINVTENRSETSISEALLQLEKRIEKLADDSVVILFITDAIDNYYEIKQASEELGKRLQKLSNSFFLTILISTEPSEVASTISNLGSISGTRPLLLQTKSSLSIPIAFKDTDQDYMDHLSLLKQIESNKKDIEEIRSLIITNNIEQSRNQDIHFRHLTNTVLGHSDDTLLTKLQYVCEFIIENQKDNEQSKDLVESTKATLNLANSDITNFKAKAGLLVENVEQLLEMLVDFKDIQKLSAEQFNGAISTFTTKIDDVHSTLESNKVVDNRRFKKMVALFESAKGLIERKIYPMLPEFVRSIPGAFVTLSLVGGVFFSAIVSYLLTDLLSDDQSVLLNRNYTELELLRADNKSILQDIHGVHKDLEKLTFKNTELSDLQGFNSQNFTIKFNENEYTLVDISAVDPIIETINDSIKEVRVFVQILGYASSLKIKNTDKAASNYELSLLRGSYIEGLIISGLDKSARGRARLIRENFVSDSDDTLFQKVEVRVWQIDD